MHALTRVSIGYPNQMRFFSNARVNVWQRVHRNQT